MSGVIPASASASTTPICAQPRAPPLPRAMPSLTLTAAADWAAGDGSFEAFRRFLDQAQIDVILDLDALLEKAQFLLLLDAGLDRGDGGHAVRVAVVIAVLALLLEEPGIERGGRRLGHLGCDLDRLLVVGRVEIPALLAQRVLHEIDQR